MKGIFIENFREFEKNRFIMFEGVNAAREIQIPDAEKVAKKMEAAVSPADLKQMRESDPEKALEILREKTADLSPEKFMENLSAEFKDATESQKENARNAYKTIYNAELAKLWRRTEQRASDLESIKDAAVDTAKAALARLKADVDTARKAMEATPKTDKVIAPATTGNKWVYKIPVLGPVLRTGEVPLISPLLNPKSYNEYRNFQYQNTKNFKEYIGAVSDKYLDSKQYEANLSSEQISEYSSLSKKVRNGMENHVSHQLEYIYSNSKTAEELSQGLTDLRDFIQSSYEDSDSNKNGILEIGELKRLDKTTGQITDLELIMASSADDETLIKRLEKSDFYNNDLFRQSSEIMTENLIRNAASNGAERKFINAVKKITGQNADMDFYQASDKFRSYMNKLSASGARETVKAFREFSKELNGDLDETLRMEEIQPVQMRELIARQKGLILSNRLIPSNIDDKMVTDFMKSSLVIRAQMLKDPTRRHALFQSIQNIKEYYPREYRKKLGNVTAKREITTRRNNPETPTSDDETARIQAMILLAKESEWVIGNLDEGNGIYTKELENTVAETTPPSTNMKFRSTDKMERVRFMSRAEASGFNGRDVALGAVKVWAGVVMFLNLMNARNQTEGHWLKGIAAMATNPWFLGGAGAIKAIDMYQKNPDVAHYLSDDKGGQEKTSTHLTLTSLAKNGKRKSVINFIATPGEFKVMESATEKGENVGKITQLLRNADNRASRESKTNPKLKDHEVITKKDLEEAGIDPKAWSQVPDTGNDRMRYLFYKSMLGNKKNIRQLQDDCEKWI